jgi:hypothetical protein
MSVGGRSILAGIGSLGSYRELMGLAAARIEVRAFRVVMIPALAIETVCCSYTSALGLRRGVRVDGRWGTYHDFM